MRQIAGYWWPDDVGEKWRHSIRHVQSLEWTLERCKAKRCAVQAGGNMGLWPRRMKAAGFARVLSFEPDAESRACLERNAPGVEVFAFALGASRGVCSIKHRSLGSHNVALGNDVEVWPLDAFGLQDVDLIQFDIEGYEWHALIGAAETIQRCRPLVHLELRSFTEKYGHSDEEVRRLLSGFGYREVQALPGNDFVFEPAKIPPQK